MIAPIEHTADMNADQFAPGDNRLQLSPDFLRLYPGPYVYCPGHDGVDHTFDVMCIGSRQHIASVYYWDERLTSELIARVVTESLNALLPAGRADLLAELKPLSKWEIAAFHGMHAGPYRANAMHCDYRGPGFEVLCDTSSESILQIFGGEESGYAQLISTEIASALNALIPPG
jgi:hypothetical protein